MLFFFFDDLKVYVLQLLFQSYYFHIAAIIKFGDSSF